MYQANIVWKFKAKTWQLPFKTMVSTNTSVTDPFLIIIVTDKDLEFATSLKIQAVNLNIYE
jgi:hypothetical protein